MVGLDTSHCLAFLQIFHDTSHPYHLAGARVVGAVPGGSSLFSLSRNRVDGFTRQVQERYGVAIYPRIEDLAGQVDAWLLESVDGRQHLDQFQRMAVGKPVFIDKPLAVSTKEAQAILQIAEQTKSPVFSCSSLRYAAGILGEGDERPLSCEAFGPAPLLEDYPGLFWYGIHAVEILFAKMGCGCLKVACLGTPGMDIASGLWEDGRVGTFKGLRIEQAEFGCLLHTTQGTQCQIARDDPPYYFNMLREVLRFFRSGIPAVEPPETFEIIAFIEAAERSKTLGGAWVDLETLPKG
jgi:hypothetical protein